MKYLRFLSILPVLLLVIAACKVSDSPTNTGGNTDGTMITTTIAGVVNDEAGQPVSGASVTVTANGVVKHSATTNKFGSFMIQSASVPESRCFILCKKNGYFTGSRAEIPKAGGITEMRLTMQSSSATYSVNAATGGKINVGNASVSFPSNAFVTNSGTPYAGTVNIAAKFVDPTKPTFYNSFSGDMTATRIDGSQTELLSYGVLRVQIKDGSGNELKIASGKTATLSYPLAASMQQNAPASMPLWYFDESLGMWKEEGSVAKSGNTYTGEVTHFTDWNCDYPGKTGTIKGRVICNSGNGVEGVYITIGQRKIVTDSMGYFSRRVPMDIDFTISINATENGGMSTPDIPITALAQDEVRTLPDIKLSNCPAMITGTIVDCEGESVPGTVVVTVNGTYICRFTNTGSYNVRVPAGVAMSLEATGYDGKLSLPVSIPMINSDEVYSAGTIAVCGNGVNAEFYDVNINPNSEHISIQNTLLSPDGSLVVVNGYREKSTFAEIFDVKSGIKTIDLPVQDSAMGAINFTADGSKLLMHWTYDSMCVVNPNTGAILFKFGKAINGRIFADGSAIAAISSYSPMKLTLYSGTDGSKIKDLSFADSYNPQLVGLRGTSLMFIAVNNQNTRIHAWDCLNDVKSSDLSFPVTFVSFSNSGFSPDGTIAAVQDWSNLGNIDFYNTLTGTKINAAPFVVPDGIKRGEAKYIGVANDNNFVIQGVGSDGHTYLPPTTYAVLNGALQKVLPIPVEGIKYNYFGYTPDGRYLAGTPGTNSSKVTVRVWKLK